MKMFWLTVPLLISLAFILLPESASAALFGPIISEACKCPNSAPDWGCVMQTMQNGMNILISLSVLVATLVIAYAGALWILSPTNPQNIEKGRTMLLNAVIGLVVVLIAWIFVDFLMKTLYDQNTTVPGGTRFGPWEEILQERPGVEDNCIVPRADPIPPPPGSVTPPDNDIDNDNEDNDTDTDDDGDNVPDTTDNCPTVPNPGQEDSNGVEDGTGAGDACEVATGTACPGPNCVNLSPEVLCVAEGCKVAQSLKTKLDALNNTRTFAVTEAYPESIPHCAVCHTNGTCVDVGLRAPTTYTADTVRSFISAAAAQGLNAEFETNSQAQATSFQAQGVSAHYYSWVSGPHFSIYGPGGTGGSTGGSNGATGCSGS